MWTSLILVIHVRLLLILGQTCWCICQCCGGIFWPGCCIVLGDYFNLLQWPNILDIVLSCKFTFSKNANQCNFHSFQVYFIVIVVVSVHAYNIGIVKYDYKILIVVTKILAREIKHLFVKETGSPRQTPHKVEVK